MTAIPPPVTARPQASAVTAADVAIYVVTILCWSSGWILMTFQVGVVPVVVSVFYRFVMSTAIMAAWVVLSGRAWRFPLRVHLRLMLMGALMFSTHFALMYQATEWVTSGLLAVVFSLVTVMNPIGAAFILGDRLTLRAIAGTVIGVSGVALVFWPEIGTLSAGSDVVKGLVFALTAVTLFSLGNIVATSVQREGFAVVATTAWGMFYGTVLLGGIALATGAPFTFDPRFPYVASLVGLTVFCTVIAFATYLTLLRRIGPGRAGYVTVMFPLGALLISWLFEGYQWNATALVGLALALGGNLLVLRRD